MESRIKIYLRLITKFDLATALFRSFEIFAVKQALKTLKIDDPILDIGCAEGNIAQGIFRGHKVFGLDNDLGFLYIAKRKFFYSSLIAADATKAPFKDNSFGFLFSNSVLEHIEDLNRVLVESKRIVKPGGTFLFTVPNNQFKSCLFFSQLLKVIGLKNLALKYAEERNKRLDHFHLYSNDSWTEIIKKFEFEGIVMDNYISCEILMLWDLIAAIQFISRKFFAPFLRAFFIKDLLLISANILKIIMAFTLLPLFFKNTIGRGCATLIVVTKK